MSDTQQFLTILEELPKQFVRVRCVCGTEKILRKQNVVRGSTKSCGCKRKEMMTAARIGKVPHNFVDLTGQRFERRLVLSYVGSKINSSGEKYSVWLTKCDCGKIEEASTGTLRASKSCGCLCREISGLTRRLPNNMAARNANLLKYKTSALKRGLSWNLSDEQFDSLTSQLCHYCEIEPKQVCRVGRSRSYSCAVTYNGIDRVDNTRGYESDNVVSCCKVCNRAKDVMTQREFIEWAGRVHNHAFR